MAAVVRTWNVFHGNAYPPQRRGFLERMVRIVTADRPAIVCLQEVPVWALRHLERWSGMQAVGAVAARPRLGSAALGGWITEVDHGLLRSALTGQAVAILLARELRGHDRRTRVVSDSGERRVCLAVRVDGVGAVGVFHVTGGPPADAQLLRSAELVAEQDGRAILAGDANLVPGEGTTWERLRGWGFSEPLPGSIDQILVRGLPASAPAAWPEDRRRVDGVLLSDHAPVELTVG